MPFDQNFYNYLSLDSSWFAKKKKNVMKFRLFFRIQKSGAIQVMNEIKVLGSKDRYGNNNKITTKKFKI